jgi:predicted methyltransferase
MRRALHALLISTLTLSATGCAVLGSSDASGTDVETRDAIVAAANGPHRSESNVARDAYRHPLETLSFFGLRKDMTVIEILPGALWYTEILAPVLADEGQYVAAWYDVDLPNQPEYRTRGYQSMVDRFEQEADVFGPARIAKFSPPDSVDLGERDSADMVLTFRSVHGWLREGSAEAAYAAFFEVLKPGGVLGVVQHRAGETTDPTKFTGYVPQETVIALAEGAGFVLEASSEINANPRDTADYPGGVWTLPPTLREGDKDRERYLAIGESDRMTLRFRKPAS